MVAFTFPAPAPSQADAVRPGARRQPAPGLPTAGRQDEVISRSDSTLRGHYPTERARF